MRLAWEYLYPSSNIMVYPIDEYILMTMGIGFIPMCAFFVRPNTVTLEASFWCSLLLSVLALVALLYANTILDLKYTASGRLSTEVLNPISFGRLGASVAILSVVYLHGRNPFRCSFQSVSSSIIGYILLFFGIGVCIASASKGPLVSLAIVLVVYSIYSLNGICKRLKTLIASLLLLSVILVTFYFNIDTFIQPITRIATTFYFEDESSVERIEMIRNGWKQFLDNPISGSALVELNMGSYPHNIVVESFMATGIIGGLLLLAIVIISLHASWHLIRAGTGYNWVGLLFIQCLIGEMFSGSIFCSASIWYYSAAVIAMDNFLRNPRIRNDIFRKLKPSSINI
jgi:hypothetical protein